MSWQKLFELSQSSSNFHGDKGAYISDASRPPQKWGIDTLQVVRMIALWPFPCR